MKTIQRNASDAEIFGRMMKVAQRGTFDGLVQEGGGLPLYLDECRMGREQEYLADRMQMLERTRLQLDHYLVFNYIQSINIREL